jgi:hypothetical protein
MTSTIAIAVSTTTRRSRGASAGAAWMCQSSPHEPRERVGLGEHGVDQLGGSVPIGGQQLAQGGPQCAQRRELRLVAVVPARVAVLGVPGVELRDGRERVRLLSAVDQIDR